MSFDIIWSPDALTTFEDRLNYLKIHFSEKELIAFTNRVIQYLDVLKYESFIGKQPGKIRNIYVGLIIKPVSLIYRVNTRKREIDLVLFIDNRQDPKKFKKYKN